MCNLSKDKQKRGLCYGNKKDEHYSSLWAHLRAKSHGNDFVASHICHIKKQLNEQIFDYIETASKEE